MIEAERIPAALSYCGAILRHTFSFWYDSEKNSYDLWFNGRTTNNYRQIHRLLEVNLDMAIHMLCTLENLSAAGCADMPTDTPLPESPHSFASPNKTVFCNTEGKARVLYSFVRDGKLYQLPLIGAGNMTRCAAYLPFPATAFRLEAPPESAVPYLVPFWTTEEGETLIPTGFFTDITDSPYTENGIYGTQIVAKGKMSRYERSGAPLSESSIRFTALYTFIGDSITLRFTAESDTPMTLRIVYAYNSAHKCEVSFNGTQPPPRLIIGEREYFTPHGGCDELIEYSAKENSVTIKIKLQAY